MAKLWGKEIFVNEQWGLLEDFSSYLEVSLLVTIEKFKSIIILKKPGWLNVARDFLTDTIPDICDEVEKYIVSNDLMNPPNWNIFLKEKLEIATRAGQLLYSYHEDCCNNCISQYQMQYQATYREQLSQQEGLGFGIISNSLAAHLVYAAQAAHKEVENEKKAQEATEKIMEASNPIERAKHMTIAFYHKTFDPFVVDFLVGFYSDIEKLIYEGLDVNKEQIENNKALSQNELSNITQTNHSEAIFSALNKYPFNGDALFWLIRYNEIDELIDFCTKSSRLLKKYLYLIEESATTYLKKQKEKANLYNRDPLTEEIIEILQRLRSFFADKRIASLSTYDNITQELYGEKIDFICGKFETLIKIKSDSTELLNYAKEHKTINVEPKHFETIQSYDIAFGTSRIKNICNNIPNEINAFNKMLFDLYEEIKIEYEKHQTAERERKQKERERAEKKRKADEDRREAERQEAIKRQEELQRQRELRKKKTKKVVAIVFFIVITLVGFSIVLNYIIIPNIKYNNAISLMDNGKYEEAIRVFEKLNGYEDSLKQIKFCEDSILERNYNEAIKLLEGRDYQSAYDAFVMLGNYSDSVEMANESMYQLGLSYWAEKDYESSNSIFKSLNDYKDSKERIHTHDYNSTVSIAPSCEAEGVMQFNCKTCSAMYSEPIGATGHNYSEEITINPTCENHGERFFSCHCGKTYSEKITALAHSYSSKIMTFATCETDGTTVYNCNCGKSYVETIPATGHNYSVATCTQGSICQNCGDMQSGALGHNAPYVNVHRCERCGINTTETIIVSGNTSTDFTPNNKLWFYGGEYKITLTVNTITSNYAGDIGWLITCCGKKVMTGNTTGVFSEIVTIESYLSGKIYLGIHGDYTIKIEPLD